jgi:hypothetical protein
MDSHAQQQQMRDYQDTIVGNEQDKRGIEVNWKSGVDFAVVLPDTVVEVEVEVTNRNEHPVSLGTYHTGQKGPDELKLYVFFLAFLFLFPLVEKSVTILLQLYCAFERQISPRST